jgi:putative DNA primase/helicase
MSINEFEQQAREADGQKAEPVFESGILESGDFHQLSLPPRKSYLHPIIQEQTITLCSGERGLGKTWFGMSIADSITQGRDLGPWEAVDSVPTLYLDGEMAALDTQSRDRILNPHNNRRSPLYFYSDAYANTLGLPRANLLNPSWRESMLNFLTDKKIKVFIIDNLASLAGGIDENAKKDWDPVNNWIIELRFKGVSIFMEHHVSKDGTQRGTSAREDNIDLSILLKKPQNYQTENGADFIVSFTKTRLPLEDLRFLQDYRFTLGKDRTGNTIWTWSTVRADIRDQALNMLKDGVPQKDIAAALGISGARVSQIKADMIRENAQNRGKYRP